LRLLRVNVFFRFIVGDMEVESTGIMMETISMVLLIILIEDGMNIGEESLCLKIIISMDSFLFGVILS
tara:strand:- start:937 stop:1140 length:204 start_codon:yes stop_codon:yes gene_type:complete